MLKLLKLFKMLHMFWHNAAPIPKFNYPATARRTRIVIQINGQVSLEDNISCVFAIVTMTHVVLNYIQISRGGKSTIHIVRCLRCEDPPGRAFIQIMAHRGGFNFASHMISFGAHAPLEMYFMIIENLMSGGAALS